MNKKKSVAISVLIFLALVLIALPITNASLGMSPASVEMNYVPGLEKTFEFSLTASDSEQEILLFPTGPLEKNIIVNKEKVKGDSKFKVTVKLPEEMEDPGNHRTLIRAKEKKDKEIASTVGTSVIVNGVIDVFVPYPKKYLELNFETQNVNAGEIAKFLLDLENKGDEDVTFTPRIEIYGRQGELKETLNMKTRSLEKAKSIKLQKKLNTTGYQPGQYGAKAIVDYEGKTTSKNGTFNIGHLFVNITDHKKKYTPGKLKEFKLETESKWNDKIKNLYAEIEIAKNSTYSEILKTSPEDLGPWQKKNLSGYFEASNFSEGEYKAYMEIFYKGETTERSGKIIFKEEKEIKTITILAIIAIVIILILITIWLLKRNKKGKNEK